MVSPREMWQRYQGKVKRERAERECQRVAAASLDGPMELDHVRHVPHRAAPLPNPLRQHPIRRFPIESSSPESVNPHHGSQNSSTSQLVRGCTPEQQSMGKDGATRGADEGSVVPKTSSLIVRAAGAGRRKNKSRSSATKSSDTKVEDGDAITVAATPVRERKPTSSVSIGTTLLDSTDVELRAVSCYMCGQKLGRPRVFDSKIEKTSFLPCGHAMGNECVFRWLADADSFKRCPRCRVTLRHKCEHIACPTWFPPKKAFEDSFALVLPFNYEFCKSPKGVKMLEEIEVEAQKLRETETKWRDRRKTASGLGLAAVRMYQLFVVHQLEKKLDVSQKAWWAVKWVEYGFGEAPRGFFSKSLPNLPSRKGGSSKQASG